MCVSRASGKYRRLRRLPGAGREHGRRRGSDPRAGALAPLSVREQVEPDPTPGAPPLSGRKAEELRWPAPPLATPLIGGLHQVAGLERAPEARLVQPPAQEELVHALQVAQR